MVASSGKRNALVWCSKQLVLDVAQFIGSTLRLHPEKHQYES